MKKFVEPIPQYTVSSINAFAARTGDYSVLMIQDDDCYDCYIKKHYDGSCTPYLFMFGLPVKQQPASEALNIAVMNVPLYCCMFEEE